MPTTIFPSRKAADAKAHLADVMTAAIHGTMPQIIQRRGGKERVVVARPDLMAQALSGFRFEAEVLLGDGEIVVRLEQFGLLGAGDSYEDAVEDALEQLRSYAGEFFRDWSLYSHTDRRWHLPWLLRFALTAEEDQAGLLAEPPASVQAPSTARLFASAV